MNMLHYKYLLFPIFFSVLVLFLSLYVSPVSAHEGKEHKIVDTSEEQKQKLQECLALPEFQDSCYFTLCSNKNDPWHCTEDIIDAIVSISSPQKAMDILQSIMKSRQFNIRSDGHLLAHRIGSSIAHHYGFSGESFLLCPEGFRWGCAHGFFEDALVLQNDPIKASVDICESAPEHPSWLKERCYHGVGHMFMFNESYDLMSALYLCDEFPSQVARQNCYQGVHMEKGEMVDEIGEELGYREDDPLAPCNRIADKYQSECYLTHGWYLLEKRILSMKDASDACLNAGNYVRNCIVGIAIMVTNYTKQEQFMALSPIDPPRETTFLENAVYLCGMVPSGYVETCHNSALSYSVSTGHIQDSVTFCLFDEVNTSDCFKYMGQILYGTTKTIADAIKKCAIAPEEYRNDCLNSMESPTQEDSININQVVDNPMIDDPVTYTETTQQNFPNINYIPQNNTIVDENPETGSLFYLPYLFMGLGSILLITPIIYYYRKKISIL